MVVGGASPIPPPPSKMRFHCVVLILKNLPNVDGFGLVDNNELESVAEKDFGPSSHPQKHTTLKVCLKLHREVRLCGIWGTHERLRFNTRLRVLLCLCAPC